MQYTATQLRYRYLKGKFFMLALIAVCLVAADEKPQTESPPDLTRLVWTVDTAKEWKTISDHLKTLTDDELENAFDALIKQSDFRSLSGYEPCLSEMIRRRGKRWEIFLKKKYDELINRKFESPRFDGEFDSGSMYSLELLAALRRIRKQPDPLMISIEKPKELIGMATALPQLEVKIKNVDVEKSEVGFTFGGNYRSGRQTRWRVVVEDEQGNVIPVRSSIGYFIMIGGGQYREDLLGYGQSWETSLNLRSFIEVPPPGKYRLTVQYHNTQSIAGKDDIEYLIVSQSKPVHFTVKPLTIELGKADRELVSGWISALEGNQKLKIVAGTYGEWAHEFILPDSPEGKLLSMGPKAIPTMINSLHHPDMTVRKKAWLLGILFSLTSENDPRSSSAVGPFEFWASGWEIWGGSNAESQSGGLGDIEKGGGPEGEIKIEDQEKLIQAWDAWLKRVVVEERD